MSYLDDAARDAAITEIAKSAPSPSCGYSVAAVPRAGVVWTAELGDMTIEDAEGYAYSMLRAVAEARRR